METTENLNLNLSTGIIFFTPIITGYIAKKAADNGYYVPLLSEKRSECNMDVSYA